MMRPVTFLVQMFVEEGPQAEARGRRSLLLMMEALANINLDYLRDHPETPKLYQSGVVYVPEFGTEEWQDIPTTLERGYGDCEDLASWRVAELRNEGIPASPYIRWREVHGTLRFHALVKHPSGRIEDPSLRLGMKKWSAYLSSAESVQNPNGKKGNF